MNRLMLTLVLVVAFLLSGAPVFAAESHTCDHDANTIESLSHCVMHAYEMGHITNQGVANSLQSKVDAGQASLNKGNVGAAINQLSAFIKEVNAQAGKAIQAEHATHLVSHAQAVIAALGG